jgi:hypothetical protein
MQMGQSPIHSEKEAAKVKITIITLFTAALIAVAPIALARNGKTPGQQHQMSKKHARISVYAPSQPKDYPYEISRQAGGGGGM